MLESSTAMPSLANAILMVLTTAGARDDRREQLVQQYLSVLALHENASPANATNWVAEQFDPRECTTLQPQTS